MTSLAEGELIMEVVIPVPPAGLRLGVRRRGASSFGVRARGRGGIRRRDGTTRVAITGVAAAPFLLEGELDDAELFGDRFAPVEYRRQLVRTLVGRATALAEERAKEDAK